MSHKQNARAALTNHGVPLNRDYHTLPSATVEDIVEAAKAHRYRKPKNANGSTARCFYEYANR